MNKKYFVAFMSILTKECTRFLRIWGQTLVPPVITASLYFVIFGNLIGSRVGIVDGVDYMSYIVPGLVMMSVITNSYANVSSSFFSSKFQNNIEEILVAPVPYWIIIAGFVGGGLLRSFLVGILVIITSLFFSKLEIYNPFLLFFTLLLTSLFFSLAGLINGIFAKTFDDVTIIPTFILTPLIYLGGVFYSITMLPEFWQNVSKFNPVLYMVNAFRYSFLGFSDVNIYIAIISLLVMICLAFLTCLRLLKKGYGIKY